MQSKSTYTNQSPLCINCLILLQSSELFPSSNNFEKFLFNAKLLFLLISPTHFIYLLWFTLVDIKAVDYITCIVKNCTNEKIFDMTQDKNDKDWSHTQLIAHKSLWYLCTVKKRVCWIIWPHFNWRQGYQERYLQYLSVNFLIMSAWSIKIHHNL